MTRRKAGPMWLNGKPAEPGEMPAIWHEWSRRAEHHQDEAQRLNAALCALKRWWRRDLRSVSFPLKPHKEIVMENIANGYAIKAQLNTAANTGALAQGCVDRPPPSLTADVAQRLETLAALVGDTGANLTALLDRLFGAIPRSGGANSAQEKPVGQAGEILTILDALIYRAAAALDDSRSLVSRI